MLHILLVSCYESGHQPLSLAWPAAFLRQDGHVVSVCDLAVQALDHDAAREADLVVISVPMHTAMRLGVSAARQVRRLNPEAHVCFFGLYAWLNSEYLLGLKNGAQSSATRTLADSVIAGESEGPLQTLAAALAQGEDAEGVAGVSTVAVQRETHLERLTFPVPDRDDLPSLDQYAHYMSNGSAVAAGYVEASRGCLHTCRHCPVTPVYGGRFFVTPVETVLADVRQQVEAGARHITFGDPDFLNGPGHALRVTRALHEEFPSLTFDFTTKVEHILERRDLFPQFREYGASFVVSAFESTSDMILERLQKGHTVADMEAALKIMRRAGIHLQPTWMPFTPWTTMDDYLHMLQWIREQGLIAHVPAVQLSIRMLVPPRSALLDHPDAEEWLGPLDPENFTYCWAHPDPRMDRLQADVAQLVEAQSGAGASELFVAVERLAYEAAGRRAPVDLAMAAEVGVQAVQGTAVDVPPPRLTEDWFC